MDIDICSQDPELDSLFSEITGKQNESMIPFLRRNFQETCTRIAEPKKASYDSYDLKFSPFLGKYVFELSEFTVASRSLKLSCALWRNTTAASDSEPSKAPLPCIIYTHTNTRSLADAVELHSLAAATGFHVLAFDLPGAGKSEGALCAATAPVIRHIDDVINWARSNIHASEIILWARGMSTAAAVEYSSASASHGVHRELIKFLVLDSPYSTVKQVIDNVVQKYREKNTFTLVVPLFRACSFLFGKEVTAKLGSDIYAVKPINFAHCNRTPCLILSARDDDYIPSSHADQFLFKWGGPCFLKSFNGTHYSSRPADVVLLAVDYFKQYLSATA